MFFLRPSGHKYVDRGDFSGWDKSTVDFTKDNQWRDLDLSGIIDPGAKLVLLHVAVQSPQATASIQFRTNGNTNIYNIFSCQGCVANMKQEYSSWVKPDANGLIEYKASIDTFDVLNFSVRGWLK